MNRDECRLFKWANPQQLKREAARLLACPVDWSSIAAGDRDRCRWLYLDWFRCIYEVAVSVDEQAVVCDMASLSLSLKFVTRDGVTRFSNSPCSA
jgi:hypothetical protein